MIYLIETAQDSAFHQPEGYGNPRDTGHNASAYCGFPYSAKRDYLASDCFLTKSESLIAGDKT
jgi:hypothetical protein